MNKPKYEIEQNWEFIKDDFDAVIVAIEGTDNYDLSMWWLEAIRIVAQDKHPELTYEFSEVIEHLSDAIHRYYPNIFEEKWKNRNIR
jgi:hypothetical protein